MKRWSSQSCVQTTRIEIYQVLTKLSYKYWIPYEETLEFFLLYYIASFEDNGRSWHSAGNCQKPIANWRRKLVIFRLLSKEKYRESRNGPLFPKHFDNNYLKIKIKRSERFKVLVAQKNLDTVLYKTFTKPWLIFLLFFADPSEAPLCEMSLSCDNLLCDALGRSPSAKIVISLKSHQKGHCWIKYCQTEVAEVSYSQWSQNNQNKSILFVSL
jgi:hypothetical protein